MAAVQIPAGGGAGQISLLANPLKPRAPLILSKVAVDKLQLKFNQFKANSNAILLGKANQLKKVVPLPNGSIRSSNVEDKDLKKAAIPIKAVPLVTEELPKSMPTNNNNNNFNNSNTKSLIRAKPSSIKALPLPSSQDIITVPAFESMEEKVVMPHLKSTHKALPSLEMLLNGPVKKAQTEPKDQPQQQQQQQERESKAPPRVQELEEAKTQAEATKPALLGEQMPEPKETAPQEPPKPPQPEPKEPQTPPQAEPKETPKPLEPQPKKSLQLQESVLKDSPKSPKLQRSKSLVAVIEETPPRSSSSERRHSVAIMAKEVDVIEQPSAPIETITIEDDDDESEEDDEVLYQKEIILPILPAGITISTTSKSGARSQLVRKNSSVTTLSSSRKTSLTASTSNSDVEEICAPSAKNIAEEISLLPGISIIKAETLPLSKEDFERSLRCDEQVPNTPPSSGASSVASDKGSPGKPGAEPTASTSHRPATKNGEQHRGPGSRTNALKRSMLQNLAMLRWRGHQPAKLQNSSMCFELNRFNLLQLNERCEQRQGPAAYFERALLDRPGRRPTGSIHPLLYLCQRCNCHGPAADFLAPRE